MLLSVSQPASREACHTLDRGARRACHGRVARHACGPHSNAVLVSLMRSGSVVPPPLAPPPKLAAARHEIAKRFTYAEAAQREEFQAAREDVQARIAASKDTVMASLETEARELATTLSAKLVSANSATKKAAA